MWFKKNGKTEYLGFIRSVEAASVVPGMSYNSSEKKVWIRHDVDYSMTHALELAVFEHKYGIRSTYFILPTAMYWDENDDRFIEQLQIIFKYYT